MKTELDKVQKRKENSESSLTVIAGKAIIEMIGICQFMNSKAGI